MADKFSVAIQYHGENGYIEYDAESRQAHVVLGDAAGREAAEKYLAEKHEIRVPHKTLRDFTVEQVEPLADLDSFKLALTRLWNTTEVHVDWSRPVEYVRLHPHLSDTKKYNEK